MKTFPFPLNSPHRLLTGIKVEIPREIQVPVSLIYHELINRMFFEHFRLIEMSSELEHFLDNLILASLNMHDGTDETYQIYSDIMEHWAKQLTCDKNRIARRALKIYHALVKARDKRKNRIRHKKIVGRHAKRKVSK